MIRFKTFADNCANSFKFLQDQGYDIDIRRENSSNYEYWKLVAENSELMVVLIFDKFTFELESSVIVEGLSYSTSEIGQAGGRDDALNWKNFCAKDDTSLVRGIALNEVRVRISLEILGLHKKDDIFLKIIASREARGKSIEKDSILQNIKPAATEAFRRQDYAEAIRLFNMIGEYMDKIDKARLKIAYKKMNS